MTIRNFHHYQEGVWDWAILDGCFGNTKITPTDIDGCVERNGKFLILETKRPGADMPTGQEVALKRMVVNGFTVIVLWGKTSHPEEMMVLTPFGTKARKAVTLDDVRQQVSRWFAWADSTKG